MATRKAASKLQEINDPTMETESAIIPTVETTTEKDEESAPEKDLNVFPEPKTRSQRPKVPGVPKKDDVGNKKGKKKSPAKPPNQIVTRKSAALDLASTSRITRARRMSTGRMDVMREKRKYVRRTIAAVASPTPPMKRKRLNSLKSDLNDEKNTKFIKTEPKDEDYPDNSEESLFSILADGNKDMETAIKQEVFVEEERMVTPDASEIKTAGSDVDSQGNRRRSTRKLRSSSPVSLSSTPEVGFRRSRKSTRLLKTTTDDEAESESQFSMDSKEFTDAEMTNSDGKDNKILEKFHEENSQCTVFSDGGVLSLMEHLDSFPSSEVEKKNTLSVDIPDIQSTELEDQNQPSTSSTNEDTKTAASLSPDMLSEVMSEISVKHFYKKPEFLENNLGIENDPKLGGLVVQEVEKVDGTCENVEEEDEEAVEVAEFSTNCEIKAECNTESSTQLELLETNENSDNELSEGYLDCAAKTSDMVNEDDTVLEEDEHNVDEATSVETFESAIDENSEANHCVDIQKETKDDDELDLNEEMEESTDIIESIDVIREETLEKTVPFEDGVKTDTEDVEEELLPDAVVDEQLPDAVVGEQLPEAVADEQLSDAVVDEQLEEDNDKITLKVEPTIITESIIEDYKGEEELTVLNEPITDIDTEEELTVLNEPITDRTEITDEEELTVLNEPITDIDTEIESTGNEQIEEEEEVVKENFDTEIETTEHEEIEEEDVLKDNLEDKPIVEEVSAMDIEDEDMDKENLIENRAIEPVEEKENVEDDVNKENIAEMALEQEEEKVEELKLDNNIAKLHESPEALHEKELHLKTLGLLTVQAALEAGVANEKRRQLMKSQNNDKKSNNSGMGSGQHEYTGTLKTVIKLNRQGSSTVNSSGNVDGKKSRQSLKMTFQKGRNRGANADRDDHSNNSVENIYYTIQNERENEDSGRGYNRAVNEINASTAGGDLTENGGKKEEEILIPEKASSFSIHPGRLCQDQCYYCGGKFGLYDTPCHVAQIKSLDRQKKILENEEKLLVDNCLCDACFRHVDRRANAPSSYKKRLSAPASMENVNAPKTGSHLHNNPQSSKTICFVPGCDNIAAHSMRRKCIRKQARKLLLNFDMSTLGTYVQICPKHYEAVTQFFGCALCKRRLGKAHVYHVNSSTDRLDKLLEGQGIPVSLKLNTGVCKLCRYFTNLLIKPPENGKAQKVEFIRNYRKRLLQFHNIQYNDQSDDNLMEMLNMESSPEKSKRAKKLKKGARDGSKDASRVSPAPSNDSSIEEILDDDSPNSKSCQMILDNDVLVDYDIPITSGSETTSNEHSPQSRLRSILQRDNYKDSGDISSALRSNPNISMRELFPGEEDLGLQVKIPFGSSKSERTPEGWTKVETVLQYDEPTRRLWEDLQKPYGNQSSFLRHLILLEKYYRNGELVLSQNASSNASVYSDSTQNRLQSYDNKIESRKTPSASPQQDGGGSVRSRSISLDKIPNTLSSAVTIIARPRDVNKVQVPKTISDLLVPSNVNTTSTAIPRTDAVEIVPIANNQSDTKKNHKSVDSEKKLPKIVSSISLPPELISLQKKHNNPSSQPKRQQPPMMPKPSTSKGAANIIILPETLSAEERLASKYWRPTLMPVTPGLNLNNQGPLYQTADGRRLPALVQVQSGGQPFLISIHDYNRMCILRREKLMRDQMLKTNKYKAQNNNPSASTVHKQNKSIPSAADTANSNTKRTNFVPIVPKPPGAKVLTVNGQQHLISAESLASLSAIHSKPKNNSNTNSGGSIPIGNMQPNTNRFNSIKVAPWSTWNPQQADGQSQLFQHNSNGNGSTSTTDPSTSSSSSLLLDSSFLSKIPKSLTVIPQQKLLPSATVTSASLAAASSSSSAVVHGLASQIREQLKRHSFDGFK